MLTSGISLAIGVDLIMVLYLPPNFFEVLFLLGFIPQLLFSTDADHRRCGARAGDRLLRAQAHRLRAANAVRRLRASSASIFLSPIPPPSPRTRPGKLLFGMSYGFGIFIAYAILRYTQQASFFDKILPVLVVNLLVRQFDAAGMWIYDRIARVFKPSPVLGNNYLDLAAYTGLFLVILPSLKFRDDVVDPFPPQRLVASPPIQELLARAIAVDMRYHVRQPWGFKEEFLYFEDNNELSRNTAEADLRMGGALLVLGQPEMARDRMASSIRKNPDYAERVNSRRSHPTERSSFRADGSRFNFRSTEQLFQRARCSPLGTSRRYS